MIKGVIYTLYICTNKSHIELIKESFKKKFIYL